LRKNDVFPVFVHTVTPLFTVLPKHPEAVGPVWADNRLHIVPHPRLKRHTNLRKAKISAPRLNFSRNRASQVSYGSFP